MIAHMLKHNPLSARMTERRNAKLWIGLILAVAAGPLCAAGPSEATRAQIQADWARQEKVTWGREAGSGPAVGAMLKRGALMIADMRTLGVEDATLKQAQDVLSQIQAAFAKKIRRTPAQWLAL